MHTHESQALGFQPQVGSSKPNSLGSRPFEVMPPGQEIAAVPSNPFVQRSANSWATPPAAPPPVSPPPPDGEIGGADIELDWRPQFSLYAAGQPTPPPPRPWHLQAKLTIGRPNDPYEQEADRVAAQVMALPAPTSQVQRQVETEESDAVQPKLLVETITPLIQRQGGSENLEPIQPKCEACEKEEQVQRSSHTAVQAQPDLESQLQTNQGRGNPLPQDVLSFMEPRFGTDFSQVRVHTDSEAVQMNRGLGAQAFTHHNHIYYGAGKAPANDELTGHELTHVVQQHGQHLNRKPLASKLMPASEAEQPLSPITTPSPQGLGNPTFLWRLVQTRLIPGPHLATSQSTDSAQAQDIHHSPAGSELHTPPEIQAKCSECEQDDSVQRQPISTTPPGEETVQANAFEDFTNWAGDRVNDVTELGADAFATIVEQISPNLAALIRNGPTALLSETLEGGIQSWVQGILGNVDLSSAVSGLQTSLETVFSTLQGVINGDQASCEAFSQGINSLRELAVSFMDNPAVQTIQDAFSLVGEVFQTITDFVIAPVFDTLMDVAGDVFNGVRALAGTIWEWGGAVRDYLSDAWDWVLGQLGISTDGEDGLLTWIQQQAAAVWEDIKATFAPVIGPLQTVLTVLVALSPAGPFLAVVTYGPQIVEAVEWLWNNKDNPDIVQAAHEQMGHTILPQLLSAAQGFSTTLQSTATALIDQVVQVSESVLQLLGAISGVPLLSMAQEMVQNVSTALQNFATWCQTSFQGAVEGVQGLATRIQEVVAPYAEVLSSLALAAVNPGMIPVIIAGWAWRAIPDCYKPPIIDFLLDAIIGILRALPDLPMLGLLWPMLKSGVLGFLEGVRNQDDDTKITITNKLAQIISGASPAFMFGFVKGLLQGIWEGITDPFVLIYTLVQGFDTLLQWLNNTADAAMGNEATAGSNPLGQDAHLLHQTDSTPASSEASSTATGEAIPSQVPPASSSGAGSATDGTIPPAEQQAISARMGEMGSELQPPAEQVIGGFMPAMEEAFSGGEGMGFEQLMQKLGEAWDAVQSAIQGAGQDLANRICEFLLQDSAEGEMGEAVGWLTGTITFEVVLGILTAATYQPVSAAGQLLQQFARVLDWTGEMMGAAFRALARIGGYVIDAVRGLGRLLSNAGGAARVVMDALQEIGEKLMQFADELLGRVGRGAAGEAAETATSRAARETVEAGTERTTREAAQEATQEAMERTGRETMEAGAEQTTQEAAEHGAREAAEETGDRGAREAAEEGSERGTRETTDDAARKAAELPAAMAQAQSITTANDAVDTPTIALVGILNATVKPQYSWLERFEARPKAIPGHYSIHMIASDHEVDSDYTDNTSSSITTTSSPEATSLSTDGPAPGAPGSPEHKAARWEEYQARRGDEGWSYEHWSNVYDANMKRASEAHEAVNAYHAEIGGWGEREVPIDVEGVSRRLDIADETTLRGIEYKTGYACATEANLWEVARDEILVQQGWEITWVFEGSVSQPLLDALDSAGISYRLISSST